MKIKTLTIIKNFVLNKKKKSNQNNNNKNNVQYERNKYGFFSASVLNIAAK